MGGLELVVPPIYENGKTLSTEVERYFTSITMGGLLLVVPPISFRLPAPS